jgi:hypothetical protein
MDLSEFVAETISEIQKGVQLAIERTKDMSGAINPVWGTANDISEAHRQMVTFDVAVTISEVAGSRAEGGLRVLGIGVGGELQEGTQNSRVSRIQFTIPIIPPVQTVARRPGY